MLEWLATYGLTATIAFGVGWWLSWDRAKARYRDSALIISRSFPDSPKDDLAYASVQYGSYQRQQNPYPAVNTMMKMKLQQGRPEGQPAMALHSYLGACVRYVEIASYGNLPADFG